MSKDKEIHVQTRGGAPERQNPTKILVLQYQVGKSVFSVLDVQDSTPGC